MGISGVCTAEDVVKPPTKKTLKFYGLDEKDWMQYYYRQDGCCPVCERHFSQTVKPVIDHVHVRGFKKMKFEKRKVHVRGLLCNFCNRRLVAKGMTLERAYNIYQYLNDYEMEYHG